MTSPRVISVTSGKGGVGKTNIVASLAMAFSKLGKQVLILDADLGLANMDIIFGMRPEFNISHVISGEKELSEIIVDVRPGIKIIPAGSGLEDLTTLTEGQKLHLLSEFEALDGTVDFVLIDTGAGISSNVIYFNLAADECIIIATHEPTSITDAYAMMKVMSNNHGAKRYKLLVNMVKDANEAKTVYLTLSQAVDRFLNGAVLEYLGFIPHDEKLKTSVLNRKPVMELYPDAPSSRQIADKAKLILNTPLAKGSEGNVKFFMKRFMAYSQALNG
ncbi:MAG: MinD/ParA family protein [Proteobacteria bacterium]|nr:MinD/ParA family protein [Pseudomonadota bacterium]